MNDARITELWEQSKNDAEGMRLGYTTQQHYFAALVCAEERKNKRHSLGPGEMELSLRREHNGELFEFRHRLTAQQVIHGPDFLVEEVAKNMDAQMDCAIRARGNT